MKRFFFFISTFIIYIQIYSQSFIRGEFFFDEDPGYGLALAINITDIGSSLNLENSIDVSSLSPGFHIFYIRYQVENAIVSTPYNFGQGFTIINDTVELWSLAESRLVYIDNQGNTLDSIASAEIFLDNDPGYGFGILLDPFTSSPIVEINRLIPTDTLSVGFHTFYLRVQTTGGEWSGSEQRLVFVDESGIIDSIASVEIFFDNDPGYGSGIILDPFTSSPIVEINRLISTDTLSVGFHTLYLRVQTAGGQWSGSEQRLVFIDESGIIDSISSLEVFFDNDLGYGSGIMLDPFTASPLVEINRLIPTDTLSVGFHTVYLRVQTTGGVWSGSEQRLVFVDESGIIDSIATVEIFFDKDPGYGQGITLDPFSASSIVELNRIISTDTLSVGFHSVYFRVQTTGGQWSSSEQRLVFIDESGIIDSISTVEIFFDRDPGYGQGINLDPFSASQFVDIERIISIDTLSVGFHTFNLRAQTTGGQWSGSEQRLVFVDESGISDSITMAEIFFDHDPGYGEGITLDPFSASQFINIERIISTDTLTIGFHTLFLRVQTSGGQWSNTEQRLVYVDKSGVEIFPISELEFFFDDDPGFGAGISIPLEIPDYETFKSFFAATLTLSEGSHILGIRARSSDNIWTIVETFPFDTYDEGRILDSLTLRTIYHQNGGVTWANNNNWLLSSLQNWYGVKISNERVSELVLPKNNITGQLPFQIGYLTGLDKINLSENSILDSIPSTFSRLQSLDSLQLRDNQLHHIPDLSSLNTLKYVELDSNFLDFGDLESLATVQDFTYTNQKIKYDSAYTQIIGINDTILFSLAVGGNNNAYQWFLNDQAISGADLNTFLNPSFSKNDTGTYYLKVTNSSLPDLTIQTQNYRVVMPASQEDSLVLVAVYEATGGENWTNNDGWLVAPLSQWYGIGVLNNRVIAISLVENNMFGQIPSDIYLAEQIEQMDFSENKLFGTVPESINNLDNLKSLRLSNNNIISMPGLNSLQDLDTLWLEGNKLQFGDLELNLGVADYRYSPQKPVSEAIDTLVERLSSPEFSISVTGSNNQYQWYKEDEELTASTQSILTFPTIDFTNEGIYRLEISNNLLPALTLTSGDIKVRVSSLARDSIALLAFYEQTQGDFWQPPVNWKTAPILEWNQITIENDRVVAIELSNRQIKGRVPADLRDITSLKSIQLHNNIINVFPDMSSMPALTEADLRNNNLDVPSVENNLGTNGFLFNPQNEFKTEIDSIVIPQGSTFTIDFPLDNSNLQYSWSYRGVPIPGATSKVYSIDSITRNKMGEYTAEATTARIETIDNSFRFRLAPQQIFASARIFGKVNGQGSIPLQTGEMFVFQIPEGGGFYDTTATVEVREGLFEVNDLILGDYTCITLTEDVTYIPTYIGDTEDWVNAKTIVLNEDTEVTNYTMLFRPEDLTGGVGNVDLTVSREDEVDNGRLAARRAVQKAGCSLRRRVSGGGRTAEENFELIAYKETNSDGQVNFGSLPVGVYRLNIQYPGIPMDTTSFTQFEIGEDQASAEYVLEAVVTDEAIVVQVIESLSLLKSNFEGLIIFPNPTQGQLELRYKRLWNDQVTASLADMKGTILLTMPLEKGKNKSISIDLSEHPVGNYVLFITDNVSNIKITSFSIIRISK